MLSSCLGYASKGERIVGELEGTIGKHIALKIWRLVPLCLMRCLWRERNARSFEDRENGLLELKKMMLQSLLYTWRVAHNSLFVFQSFWNFVILFLFYRGFLLFFLCTRIVPFCTFIVFTLLFFLKYDSR